EVRVADHEQLGIDHVVGQPPAVAQDRAGQDGPEPVRVADLELQHVGQQQAGDDVGGRRGLPEDAGQDALHVGLEVADVVAGLAGAGRGNAGGGPLATNALNPPASKKNGSSWTAARNIPAPVTGMFVPVLPRATIPVGGNFVEGSARIVTSCTPLASGGPNVV